MVSQWDSCFISTLVCRIMNPMSSNDGEIIHVSDTALMVAACRAHETELEDAFVRDPFAARLAGERGLASMGKSRMSLCIFRLINPRKCKSIRETFLAPQRLCLREHTQCLCLDEHIWRSVDAMV